VALVAVGLVLVGLVPACSASVPSLSAPTDGVSGATAAVPVTAVVRVTENVRGSVRPPVSPAPGLLAALEVLALIPVENEHHSGYDRELFGYPADLDGDGCDTRAEMLIRGSLTPAQVDPSGCGVVAGDWYSPYDDVTWSDPGEVQIDHVVALSEAWDSGAWAWDQAMRVAYGNDLDDARSLRAVTGALNADKGNKDPSNWIPPNDAYVCEYLADWVAIKARWGLSMDQSEFGRIRNLLTKRCPGQLIEPGTGIPVVPVVPVVSAVPLPSLPSLPATTVASAGGDCDPSYPTVCIPPSPPDLDCADVPYRRFEVLPPDPHRFDGDHNGLGCER